MKKIPMRSCIACREKKPKKQMVRIIYNQKEGLTYDLTGKKNGRGAYICLRNRCLDQLTKDKISTALKCIITDEDINKLKVSLGRMIKDNCHVDQD